jgi:hypothetical protein
MQKWLIIAGVVLVVALSGGAFVAKRVAARLPGYVRNRALTTLREHFDGEVEVGDLQVMVYPKIVLRGKDLVVRLHGRKDIPPLISVKNFSTEVALGELLQRTRHIRKITLKGLTVTMPPAETRPSGPPLHAHGKKESLASRVLVDEIVADGAELDMLVKEPDKPPHVFTISRLRLQHAGLGRPMDYQATLTNPVPVGEIDSHGEFGPWQTDEPRLTPVHGVYTFSHADLSTIHGLSGILTSTGDFNGPLDRIDVQGTTTTPDFSLGISGHPVPLETTFHAIVDGTTGNTMLDPVHAKLLHSEFVARGGVFRVPGQKSRRVLLDAVSDHSRLEDLLRLALKADKPPMTGDVSFRSRIDIPPGTGAIADRLKLDGKFHLSSAQFSQLNIQSKVAALSHRGRGQTDPPSSGSVASDFAGNFVLRNGLMTFSNLIFGVPGASVHLDGTYALQDQQIDFSGSLRLQATVSQLTKGWKSVLLKPFDPLFEKQGAGTFVPITVTGTGSDPRFGVNFHKIF